MIGAKILITGVIVRMDAERFIIRRGDVVESYSRKYYRVITEAVDA